MTDKGKTFRETDQDRWNILNLKTMCWVVGFFCLFLFGFWFLFVFFNPLCFDVGMKEHREISPPNLCLLAEDTKMQMIIACLPVHTSNLSHFNKCKTECWKIFYRRWSNFLLVFFLIFCCYFLYLTLSGIRQLETSCFSQEHTSWKQMVNKLTAES